MRILMTALAGAMALSGLAASAQEFNTGHLAAVDTDGDGSVSADELNAVLEGAFVGLDGNGDGQVTAEEAGAVISAEQFVGADSDGSSSLSQAEFNAQIQEDFAAADADGSGGLD